MDANLKKYALVKGNLYYTYGKTQLTMFFDCILRLFSIYVESYRQQRMIGIRTKS